MVVEKREDYLPLHQTDRQTGGQTENGATERKRKKKKGNFKEESEWKWAERPFPPSPFAFPSQNIGPEQPGCFLLSSSPLPFFWRWERGISGCGRACISNWTRGTLLSLLLLLLFSHRRHRTEGRVFFSRRPKSRSFPISELVKFLRLFTRQRL